MNTRNLRDAFSLFATGVTVVTGTRPDGVPVGVTANSFSSVSLDPPLLLWCLQNESTSFDAFAVGRHFAVHVLRQEQEGDAMYFARRAALKFPAGDGETDADPPTLDSSLCRFDCMVDARHGGGDHSIIVGRITGFMSSEGDPLVFQRGVFGGFAARTSARHVESWETFSGDWF